MRIATHVRVSVLRLYGRFADVSVVEGSCLVIYGSAPKSKCSFYGRPQDEGSPKMRSALKEGSASKSIISKKETKLNRL